MRAIKASLVILGCYYLTCVGCSLTRYEHIDETVNVKGTTNPNVKARELADKGILKDLVSG